MCIMFHHACMVCVYIYICTSVYICTLNMYNTCIYMYIFFSVRLAGDQAAYARSGLQLWLVCTRQHTLHSAAAPQPLLGHCQSDWRFWLCWRCLPLCSEFNADQFPISHWEVIPVAAAARAETRQTHWLGQCCQIWKLGLSRCVRGLPAHIEKAEFRTLRHSMRHANTPCLLIATRPIFVRRWFYECTGVVEVRVLPGGLLRNLVRRRLSAISGGEFFLRNREPSGAAIFYGCCF